MPLTRLFYYSKETIQPPLGIHFLFRSVTLTVLNAWTIKSKLLVRGPGYLNYSRQWPNRHPALRYSSLHF